MSIKQECSLVYGEAYQIYNSDDRKTKQKFETKREWMNYYDYI